MKYSKKSTTQNTNSEEDSVMLNAIREDYTNFLLDLGCAVYAEWMHRANIDEDGLWERIAILPENICCKIADAYYYPLDIRSDDIIRERETALDDDEPADESAAEEDTDGDDIAEEDTPEEDTPEEDTPEEDTPEAYRETERYIRDSLMIYACGAAGVEAHRLVHQTDRMTEDEVVRTAAFLPREFGDIMMETYFNPDGELARNTALRGVWYVMWPDDEDFPEESVATV